MLPGCSTTALLLNLRTKGDISGVTPARLNAGNEIGTAAFGGAASVVEMSLPARTILCCRGGVGSRMIDALTG